MATTRADREKEHFDGHVQTYEDSLHMNCPAALYKVARLTDRYAAFLAAAPEGPVVEIGAGTGFYTRHIAPKCAGRQYIATDLSAGMLSQLKASLQEAGHGSVVCQEEDCLATSFADASVAAVTGHGILHHLPVAAAIREISRVLMPGGRIAFYEPNILNPYVCLLFKKMKPEGFSEDEMALNPFKVKAILKEQGFCQIKIVPYELTLNNLPSWLVRPSAMFSWLLSKLPLLRYMGGSLKITAVKG